MRKVRTEVTVWAVRTKAAQLTSVWSVWLTNAFPSDVVPL